MIQSIADTLILAWGWRRLAIAFFLGALGALALPPFQIFPVLWISFCGLVWLIDGTLSDGAPRRIGGVRAAAAIGWWFGFGYFLAGLWWIGSAFLVEASDFAWMIPFAVTAMPAGLALFWALAAALARALWVDGWVRIPLLAACLATAEWLRGHVLSGFPWNAIGYGFSANDVMMQPAALIGLYGLTFFALVVFSAPAIIADVGSYRARYGFVAVVALLFAASFGYGVARLKASPPADVADVRLRLVQPDIPQKEKWLPQNADWIFTRYLDLSSAPNGPRDTRLDKITHLIWPESAFPFLLTQRPDALSSIAKMLPDGTTLITGAVRAAPGVDDGKPDFFNSVYVIADDGTIIDAYDKVHLVPFGEYLPLRKILTALGIEHLTRVPGGFTAGFRHRQMRLPGAPQVSPLICYEAIFPGAVADRANRPGWLLNLTNDAWFGDTPGPYQQLEQARMRAVEEGLPLIRVANTGISAVIDAHGRIRHELPLSRSGVIDTALPGALPPTLYVRLGDVPFALLVVGSLALAIVRRKGRIRSATDRDGAV